VVNGVIEWHLDMIARVT